MTLPLNCFKNTAKLALICKTKGTLVWWHFWQIFVSTLVCAKICEAFPCSRKNVNYFDKISQKTNKFERCSLKFSRKQTFPRKFKRYFRFNPNPALSFPHFLIPPLFSSLHYLHHSILRFPPFFASQLFSSPYSSTFSNSIFSLPPFLTHSTFSLIEHSWVMSSNSWWVQYIDPCALAQSPWFLWRPS